VSSTDTYNVYGVIIDATTPYETKTDALCKLRLIDQSLNHLVNRTYMGRDSPFVNVSLFGEMAKLPRAFRIGDIIRIHRMTAQDYNGNLELKGTVHLG